MASLPETTAQALWRVCLRCGACGHERDTLVELFAVALRRDLIDVEDF